MCPTHPFIGCGGVINALIFIIYDSNLPGEKYGLKLNLNAIILRTIKSLKGLYSEAMEDDKVRELDYFTDAYNFRAHEMYAAARYKAITQSMDKSRRPASLPQDRDIEQMKSHIKRELQRLTASDDVGSDYVLLRSLVVCRLTLFNGRRGEEPARMLLSEWSDARDGSWLRQHKVSRPTLYIHRYIYIMHFTFRTALKFLDNR